MVIFFTKFPASLFHSGITRGMSATFMSVLYWIFKMEIYPHYRASYAVGWLSILPSLPKNTEPIFPGGIMVLVLGESVIIQGEAGDGLTWVLIGIFSRYLVCFLVKLCHLSLALLNKLFSYLLTDIWPGKNCYYLQLFNIFYVKLYPVCQHIFSFLFLFADVMIVRMKIYNKSRLPSQLVLLIFWMKWLKI